MNMNLIILTISLITVLFMVEKISKKEKNILYKHFGVLNCVLAIHIIGLMLQILFSNTSIPPIYFDYITYISGVFTPAIFGVISFIYYKPSINTKKLRLLYILPIITLLVVWTNDLHHLFYKVYSINISENVYGPFFYVYSIYSYLLIFIAFVTLLITSMKKSGFFSIQTFLMILGGLIPITVNILGTLKIIPMTIYITPILFIVTSICYYLAIFKFKALNITPVAFRTVIDTMSDAYVVISDDGTIADMNKTFERKFSKAFNIAKEDNFFHIVEKSKSVNLKDLKDSIKKTRKNGSIVTEEYHFQSDGFNKYFEVDIHPISAKSNSKEYIGTLLLFKDITQHKEDIKEIEEKQDIIVKQGQLVSIGELAGGVAHDINTPISAIKTGIVMLNQMGTKTEEEKEVLQRMDNCATKIINIVNSMRNQIRNLGSDNNVKFKISDVVNDIKVITYHEVAKNKSEVIADIKDDLEITGDPTKLGQVLTNLVVNAAQAYGSKKGGKIEITVEKGPKSMAIIKVADYAGGLDESITPYIFKNILTTKGTVGTGLGLYLAYSVIKGNFNGEITFDTAKGEGTTFYIAIPRS